jgi:RNA polymerase sigma-70 factor (ECF subfamily)
MLVAMEDADLVAQSRAGDRAAFDQLVERHRRDVLASALGLLGNRDDAEEAVQEAFVRAWEGLESLRDPARFKAWLGGVLYRLCIDRLRGVARERRRDRRASRPVSIPDEASQVVEASLGLPDDYRHALVLFYLHELTLSELADALGITEVNAKVRLHRARRMLRERLESRGGSE